jgi:integrase
LEKFRWATNARVENTINSALRAMGFSADEVTGHGFRATARTMLRERLGSTPMSSKPSSRIRCVTA